MFAIFPLQGTGIYLVICCDNGVKNRYMRTEANVASYEMLVSNCSQANLQNLCEYGKNRTSYFVLLLVLASFSSVHLIRYRSTSVPQGLQRETLSRL